MAIDDALLELSGVIPRRALESMLGMCQVPE
jgi:hypothetical protein